MPPSSSDMSTGPDIATPTRLPHGGSPSIPPKRLPRLSTSCAVTRNLKRVRSEGGLESLSNDQDLVDSQSSMGMQASNPPKKKRKSRKTSTKQSISAPDVAAPPVELSTSVVTQVAPPSEYSSLFTTFGDPKFWTQEQLACKDEYDFVRNECARCGVIVQGHHSRHQATHTDEERTHCTTCNQIYNTNGSFNNHLKGNACGKTQLRNRQTSYESCTTTSRTSRMQGWDIWAYHVRKNYTRPAVFASSPLLITPFVPPPQPPITYRAGYHNSERTTTPPSVVDALDEVPATESNDIGFTSHLIDQTYAPAQLQPFFGPQLEETEEYFLSQPQFAFNPQFNGLDVQNQEPDHGFLPFVLPYEQNAPRFLSPSQYEAPVFHYGQTNALCQDFHAGFLPPSDGFATNAPALAQEESVPTRVSSAPWSLEEDAFLQSFGGI